MNLTTSHKVSPLARLCQERFGGRTTLVERTVTINNMRSTVLANNPNRLFWMIQNEGSNDARLSTDGTITITSGWSIQANGGLVSMFWEQDGEGVGFEVYGLSVVDLTTFRIMEVIVI